MTKGERFIICKGKHLEKDHRGMVLWGAMVIGGLSVILLQYCSRVFPSMPKGEIVDYFGWFSLMSTLE
jgi:hypothetical protein